LFKLKIQNLQFIGKAKENKKQNPKEKQKRKTKKEKQITKSRK